MTKVKSRMAVAKSIKTTRDVDYSSPFAKKKKKQVYLPGDFFFFKWLCDNVVQNLEARSGLSPNLNPMENCWTTVKKAVVVRKPSSVHRSSKHGLHDSMPSRIKQDLRKKYRLL